jgi:hypothetical protein
LCLRLKATLIRSSLFRPAFWSSPSQPPSALSSSRYLHAHQAGSGSLATPKSTDPMGSAAGGRVPNDVFSENTDQAGAGPNTAPRLLLLLLRAHGTRTTPTFRWPDPGAARVARSADEAAATSQPSSSKSVCTWCPPCRPVLAAAWTARAHTGPVAAWAASSDVATSARTVSGPNHFIVVCSCERETLFLFKR